MMSKCVKNGFHDWQGNVESTGESYDKMEVHFTCNICGAEADGTVYWIGGEE